MKTWIEKAGLSIYKNRSHKEIEGAYSAIVDGSISSGDQLPIPTDRVKQIAEAIKSVG